VFYDRLSSLCEAAGTNITRVAEEVLKVSNATPTNWKKGVSPKASIIEDAAKYFRVSADYLLGLSDDPSPIKADMRKLDAEETLLIDKLRRADPPLRAAVLRMADAALSMPPTQMAAQPAGPSFLSVNDEMVRPKRREKAACGLKRVEGNAAAGVPITAVPEDDLMASVPVKYMSDRYFIVRAKGDSMINADINDGDFCIFQKDAYLDEGNIMLVQVDGVGEEPDVTIKRVFFRGEQVELRAENPTYDPMFYPSADVRLMGVLVLVVTPEVDTGGER